jgi:hypothetical protein
MKLTINGDTLDFEAPVHMTEDQLKQFLIFLKKEFHDNVIEEPTAEKTKKVQPRGESTNRDWTVPEFAALLDPNASNSELAIRLKRSVMSVLMMRGHFVPEFIVWAKKKGYSSNPNENKINEFITERDAK